MTATAVVPRIYGDHEDKTIEQLVKLGDYGSVEYLGLMADGHFGYSQPVGGVVAYADHISVSGVGFDIGCGNMAVQTDMQLRDIDSSATREYIANRITGEVAFGVGRVADVKTDHALFDSMAWETLAHVAGRHEADKLKAKAHEQLGTVGSGNHYVDVFAQCDRSENTYHNSDVWVGVHFGSRGLGHTIASGFLKLAAGHGWDHRPAKGERVESEIPTLLEVDSDLGRAYLQLMELAGEYAMAGREIVVNQVVGILDSVADTSIVDTVHNHHNYAWRENHGGKDLWVVRKGATPLAKDQRSFIGGSMCDVSVIVRGNGYDSEETLDSTVHGAGRVMGRMAAKGKVKRRPKLVQTGGTHNSVNATFETQYVEEVVRPGLVSREQFDASVKEYGITLRGGDIDESVFVYRDLDDVLSCHPNTEVETRLRPIIVAMAGSNVVDPWKD